MNKLCFTFKFALVVALMCAPAALAEEAIQEIEGSAILDHVFDGDSVYFHTDRASYVCTREGCMQTQEFTQLPIQTFNLCDGPARVTFRVSLDDEGMSGAEVDWNDWVFRVPDVGYVLSCTDNFAILSAASGLFAVNSKNEIARLLRSNESSYNSYAIKKFKDAKIALIGELGGSFILLDWSGDTITATRHDEPFIGFLFSNTVLIGEGKDRQIFFTQDKQNFVLGLEAGDPKQCELSDKPVFLQSGDLVFMRETRLFRLKLSPDCKENRVQEIEMTKQHEFEICVLTGDCSETFDDIDLQSLSRYFLIGSHVIEIYQTETPGILNAKLRELDQEK